MNINVSLSDDLAEYVKAKVESGLYASTSDVVSDALRLLEERDSAGVHDVERLKKAWHEGLRGSDFSPLDIDALKAEGRARIATKNS